MRRIRKSGEERRQLDESAAAGHRINDAGPERGREDEDDFDPHGAGLLGFSGSDRPRA